jgi:hypothetical protein
MHQTVGGRKHFLKERHTFVCMVFEGRAARYEEKCARAGTPVILKQNRRPDGKNRTQIASSAFAFVRGNLLSPDGRSVKNSVGE